MSVVYYQPLEKNLHHIDQEASNLGTRNPKPETRNRKPRTYPQRIIILVNSHLQ